MLGDGPIIPFVGRLNTAIIIDRLLQLIPKRHHVGVVPPPGRVNQNPLTNVLHRGLMSGRQRGREFAEGTFRRIAQANITQKLGIAGDKKCSDFVFVQPG